MVDDQSRRWSVIAALVLLFTIIGDFIEPVPTIICFKAPGGTGYICP